MSDERLEYLARVAVWYYEDNLDQNEIARRLGKSRSMVSRLLTEARDAGLVETRVRFPLRTDLEIAERFAAMFDVKAAVVLANPGSDYNLMVRRLGRLGAKALQGHLRAGVTLAIGWGAALHAVVRAMPDIRIPDAMVLQAMGSVGGSDPGVDGADLARALASKLDGDFQSIPAPLIVDSVDVARSLRSDRGIRRTLDAAAQADVLITGIGSIQSSVSGLFRAGYFNDDDLHDLRGAGIVGDVMGHPIDIHGNVLDTTSDRVIGLRPEDIASAETVIGVAGGIVKADAITGAVRTGIFDVIVLDAGTAAAMLDPATRHSMQEAG